MMPELGKYADTVLSAYAASIVLVVALVALTLVRGRKVRREIKQLEERMAKNG